MKHEERSQKLLLIKKKKKINNGYTSWLHESKRMDMCVRYVHRKDLHNNKSGKYTINEKDAWDLASFSSSFSLNQQSTLHSFHKEIPSTTPQQRRDKNLKFKFYEVEIYP